MPGESDAAQDGYAAPSRHREFSLFFADQLRNLRLGKAEPGRGRHRLAARAHAELGEHRGDMVIHGLFGDEQPAGDVGVATAFDQKAEDLAGGWSCRRICRVRSWRRAECRHAAGAVCGARWRPWAPPPSLEDLKGGAQGASLVAIGHRRGLFVGTADLFPGRAAACQSLASAARRARMPGGTPSRRPCRHSQKASSP
jgi:hypothetical protein